MALVNGGFSHYRDMKKFLKKSSSPKLELLSENDKKKLARADFEIFSQEYSLSDPF